MRGGRMFLQVISMDSRTKSISYGWTIECKVERASESCLGLSGLSEGSKVMFGKGRPDA